MVINAESLLIMAGAAAGAAVIAAVVILPVKRRKRAKPKHSVKRKRESVDYGSYTGAVLYLNPVSEGAQLSTPLGERVTVGRGADMDIVVEDRLVSAEQCVFTCEDGIVYIEDAGSTNGTILNGILLKAKTAVKDGDTILIGNSEYSILIM